jgi:alcohol dehydrogenase class IV
VNALQERMPDCAALSKYDRVACLLTGRSDATWAHGVEWIRELVSDFRIPSLGSYGVGQGDLAEIVQRAERASSMKANPITLQPDELTAILSQAP